MRQVVNEYNLDCFQLHRLKVAFFHIFCWMHDYIKSRSLVGCPTLTLQVLTLAEVIIIAATTYLLKTQGCPSYLSP